MLIVGLTGSIAMGKSEAVKTIRQLGIPVFDADNEVHQLYNSEEGGALLRDFAPAAMTGGRIDRAKLSSIVLGDPEKLHQLETIVHAEITKRRKTFLDAARHGDTKIVVLDIPLLFEKNLATETDVTVVVSAPEAMQHERALARSGMTRQKLASILQRQMPDAEKRQRADYVIENNGTLEELEIKTRSLFARLANQQGKNACDS